MSRIIDLEWRAYERSVVPHDAPAEPGDPVGFSDTLERAFGDFTPGRYAWYLDHVRALAQPVPCRGFLWLWQVSDELERQIRRTA